MAAHARLNRFHSALYLFRGSYSKDRLDSQVGGAAESAHAAAAGSVVTLALCKISDCIECIFAGLCCSCEANAPLQKGARLSGILSYPSGRREAAFFCAAFFQALWAGNEGAAAVFSHHDREIEVIKAGGCALSRRPVGTYGVVDPGHDHADGFCRRFGHAARSQ